MCKNININVLVGRTLKEIIVSKQKDCITFITSENKKYKMYHDQDCCENVTIDDINGDLQLLIGKPILIAEKVSNKELPKQPSKNDTCPDSFTWTFYKIANNRDFCVIKWYGSSNGYYSESVSFMEVE